MKGDQKEDQSTRSKKELEICAYHESGHVIATKLYTNDRIPKVTIISSTSGAGGVTFRTPEETGLVSKAYLEGSVKMMYAGRAAEEIYFGNTDMITTGASSDIKQATEIIKSYIGVYGMSDEYGLINLAAFNNVNQEELIQKASTLAKTLYNEVRDDISRNKDLLEKLSTELLAHESLSESEIESIFNSIGLNK
jgi:cell division protease FtsH